MSILSSGDGPWNLIFELVKSLSCDGIFMGTIHSDYWSNIQPSTFLDDECGLVNLFGNVPHLALHFQRLNPRPHHAIPLSRILLFIPSLVTITMKLYALFVTLSLVLLPVWFSDPKRPVPGKFFLFYRCQKCLLNWRPAVYRLQFGEPSVIHSVLVFIFSRSSIPPPNVILLEDASSVDGFLGRSFFP